MQASTGDTGTKAPATKVDLSGLNALNMDGQLSLGQLKHNAVNARDVRLAVKAQKRIALGADIGLKAFGGAIAASGTATTTSSPHCRITVKPDITGVDIYALLKQFAGFEKIEGKQL